jgi:hypothetical protein
MTVGFNVDIQIRRLVDSSLQLFENSFQYLSHYSFIMLT